MGGAYSTYGREKYITEWGDQLESDHLENLGVKGRIILKCIFKRLEWEHGLD
jgi:hypothetical protein